MYDQYSFSIVDKNNQLMWDKIESLLADNDLAIDTDIESFVAAWSQEKLVACGGIAGRVLKCIAIDSHHRGDGLSLKLLTELIHLAFELGRRELFLFTKPANKALFSGSGFFPLVEVKDQVVLMENSANRLSHYCQQLARLRHPGDKIGAIVMNANPFTLGHRYLVEQAARQSDWLHVFVVKEDASQFSYTDRLALVQAGVADLSHVTVHSGSDYLISRATFPSYFIKDEGIIDQCHSEIDLQLFRRYLAPALGITQRFVGSEPLCQVTNAYNQQMKQILQRPQDDSAAIEVIEIQRLMIQGEAVSASRVRRLLQQGQLDDIVPLVPASTMALLQQHNIAQQEQKQN